ncbi:MULTISPECIES: FHA domain-containing protein [Kribbella]|uniref:FHA domain-containing protein n=1 Tax=Kribbella karoonensis TaxID=324851 RepID=A0ABN2ERG4_9ACTN
MAGLSCAECGDGFADEWATACIRGHERMADEVSWAEPLPIRAAGGLTRPVAPAAGQRLQVLLTLDGGPITVDRTDFVLGRQRTADSPLADQLDNYPNVSRKHVQVQVFPDHFLVVDEGSTNNTFIGDRPIKGTGPQRLEARASLRLARNCTLKLAILGDPGSLR